MGLLTDTSQAEKISNFVLKYHVYLSSVSFLVGVAWFAALAFNDYNGGTYISENALLPGLVESEFNLDYDAGRYLENLQEEMERYQGDMPTSWLRSQFRQLGLEVYLHNFSLHYPFGSRPVYSGRNVYSIMRAPRAASTEALVLSVPFRSINSVHPTTAPGIALMFALAKFFRKHTYWAKDVIFLITEHEQLGAKAWLEAYHGLGSSAGVLDAGLLESRSGAIQAAINLELHGQVVTSVDVKIEGLTGQLPNLDLFNLVVRLCSRENVPVTFKNRKNHQHPQRFEGWRHNLATLMSMVSSQASGVPTGNHGLFLRYNIEALTLEGHKAPRKRGPSFHQMGRVLEGIFRSLNNLLESFHQSFFFYLLPSTDHYISIGLYMPPFALILLPMLITALKLRIETHLNEPNPLKPENKPSKINDKTSISMVSILPNIVVCHLIGAALFLATPLFDLAGRQISISTEDSMLYGIFAVFVSVLLLPYFVHRHSRNRGECWQLLKCATLLEMALLLAAVALVNFSLALMVAVVSVPVFATAAPSNSRIRRVFKSIFVILISPLCLLFLSIFYDTYLLFPDVRIDSLFVRATVALKRALVFSITDSYIYDNWMFGITCLFHYSAWMQLWSTQYMPTTTDERIG